MLHNYAKKCFANQKGHEQDLLMICCVDKTMMGWHAERSITIMRERCGGQGFLAANTFGEAIAGCHAALTAEGDNLSLIHIYISLFYAGACWSIRFSFGSWYLLLDR